jgi:hypothetical protein
MESDEIRGASCLPTGQPRPSARRQFHRPVAVAGRPRRVLGVVLPARTSLGALQVPEFEVSGCLTVQGAVQTDPIGVPWSACRSYDARARRIVRSA